MSIPLYISDLDGTLLRPDGTLSDYSRDGLNRLIADGMHFTVATARSVVSIRQLLQGLQLSLPVINLNGALLSDLHSGRHQSIQAISPETAELVFDQIRSNRLEQIEDLRLALADPVLCFTVIDHRRTLLQDVRASLENCFPGQLQIYLFGNSYSDVGDTWLTIGDAQATKDRGIRQLLAQGGYAIDGLTVFGDSDNDVEMFRLAPRAIATANASEEIRTLATEIIGRNSEDSVVLYLHGQY
jgi:HAD superfamily hydrolase (TIGR01484 family)